MSFRKVLAICLIFTPILFFGYLFQKYAINIPHWDDLAVRNTIADYLKTDSFIEKIRILFSQHNEHRIVLTRIFALLIYATQGFLDLKTLMIFGNLSLVGLLFIFYKNLQRSYTGPLALVPVAFLIFNIGLYENVFWGMASVQNFWVILLASACFYLLVHSFGKPNNVFFYLALLLSFTGTFTSSNGILIPLIGIGILAFQRRNRELIVWSVAVASFLFLYFFDYHKVPDTNLKADFSDKSLLVKGLFAVLGNAVDVSFIAPSRHLDISMATGVIITILAAMFAYQVLFKRYDLSQRNNDLFLLACLAFLVITCVGIVVGRIAYGIEVLLTSKYKINSVLILVICYIILLRSVPEWRQKNMITFAIILSILFNGFTYLADLPSVRYLRHERITDQFKIQHSDKEMPTQGIYAKLQRPEQTFYDALMPVLLGKQDSVKAPVNIQENETGFIISYANNNSSLDISSADAGQYTLLRSSENIYMFPDRIVTPNALRIKDYLNFGFLVKNQLKVNSFVSEFTKFYVRSGRYQLGFIRQENNQSHVTWTNQSIDIKTVQKEKPKQNW
ncbi:hypothetical protein [Emticicia sp. 17c]|uniref:hypothetical protein n=1 Tax=Emticicia sp. 17c TaxID=3127704 RepID=UPI00301DA0CE